MKLIKVEAKGFKSFADRTVLRFDGGVVGIVGPNGSGKSNINDAIKWVLGESSAKSLRGDSMEDVIFAGSKTVKAMDKAEVSLTFDNTDGAVKVPHKILTITRILKRGKGGNEYYINGELARLRDIKEIAMESGIGKSSLAIISQGTVADIAQATPEQRRGIFEEAAGISKYKNRKKEALRKLEKTTEGLEKIKTVVNELERQLNPLKRQADKAKIYLEKHKKLKDIEVGLIVEDVEFFSKKLEELNSELEDVLATKEDLNERINSSEIELEQKNAYKLNLENGVHDLTNKFQEISDKLRDLEVRDSQETQRRQMIINGEMKTSSKEKISAMKEELEELSAKISQYNIWEKKSQEKISEKRTQIAEVQTNVSKMSIEADRSKNNILKVKTKISILKDYRDNKTNLYKGTKTIVENASLFDGFEGIVSDIIKADTKYIACIEAILQSALQHVVVDQSSTAVKAVNFLKNNNGGRATFIPLSSISPKGIRDEHINVLRNQEGFIGVAAELVNVDPKFSILKKFLLGHILIADDIKNANYIAELVQKRYMIVTLDGDIIRAGGIISGGARGKSNNMIGIDDQIKKLEAVIPTMEIEMSAKVAELNQLSVSTNEDHLIIGELNIEIAKVREKRSMAKQKFSQLKTQYETESQETLKLEETEQVFENVEMLEAEKSSIQTLLKAKRDSIMSLNNDLSRITIIKTELEKSLREIVESSSSKMTEKNQAEYILKSSKQRLSEEYEMTIEAAQQSFELSTDREEARKVVAELRQAIKQLGHVNLDSIDAFEEVNERFTKLKDSEEELFSAQQAILAAVNEMDKIIISRLDQTVKDVNEEMNNIFRIMFGGGEASLKYTDPSNLLETGIEVIAQPPGKTVKNLKLFSGGEKALVAISLLFAILKSKPLPLAILDEVEAALDDANVVRYADFLQELKEKTQFIVVTHRVGTMARVDHLFGATMQQRGVTSFFTVELSKAKELLK